MTDKGGRFTPSAIQIHVHSSCGYMHSFRRSNLIGYFRSTVAKWPKAVWCSHALMCLLEIAVWHEERWINLQAGDMLSFFHSSCRYFYAHKQAGWQQSYWKHWMVKRQAQQWRFYDGNSILNCSTLLSLPPHKSRKLWMKICIKDWWERVVLLEFDLFKKVVTSRFTSV